MERDVLRAPGTARMLAGLAATAAVLTGCTSTPSPPATATPTAPPPAPPAACLLDAAALAGVTGLTWTPDQNTASDTRCVYDPNTRPVNGAPGAEFLAVEIAPTAATDPGAELDSVAAACAARSRIPLRAGTSGFVCRFRGGSVFAAVVRSGKLVTVSAAAEAPAGTTTARLVLALQQQLDALGD